ncbi:MAG: PASTA domain-containing protein [Eubacteriales bacterium]
MDNQFLNKYEQKSEFTPPKPKKSKPTKQKMTLPILPIAIGGAVVVGVIITLMLVFNNDVTLPDMSGWKEQDVNLWASENTVMLRYSEEYSDEIESGLVVAQKPGEGEIVSDGEFLEIILSKGADLSILVTIPDFLSMSKDQIEKWASDNYMTKVRITAENSQTVEQGKVITFTVNDNTVIGQEVRRDSPIYVIISNGTGENGKVTLPDFTTMNIEMSNIFAEGNQIILEIEEVFSEGYAKGQIISQDIKAEEVINVGDTVKLTVSLGPEVIMPDFSSYSKDMAATVASQNGIVYMIEESYSSAAEGKLISQSISAGSLYEAEEILTLKYSLGNTILVPSYVGSGVDALNAWIIESNAKGTKLKYNVVKTASNEAPDTIITQDKADVKVGIDATISVLASQGKVVYVPDLVADLGSGYKKVITREKALELCNAVGIIPVFQSAGANDRLEGEVWSQSIEAGKEVQQGTTIILKYRPVTSTIVVPNFVGMTEQEVMAAEYYYQYELEISLNGATTIQSQSILAGTTVAPGTKIQLTSESVVIPDTNTDNNTNNNTDTQ